MSRGDPLRVEHVTGQLVFIWAVGFKDSFGK